MKTALTRFEEKIIREPMSGCWLWVGSMIRNGYGMMRGASKNVLAHRWAYEHYVGPIPEGLELDHLCRNRACANPNHLEPVTHRENAKRGIQGNKAYCKHGHEFNEENTILRPAGNRGCRACQRDADRRRLAKEKMLGSRRGRAGCIQIS